MSGTGWRRSMRILAVGLMCSLAGCAFMDKKNRLLLNKMDGAIKPRSTAARVVLAPAVIPAGTIAVAIDAVAIHPVRVIPEAWDDVYELYWRPRDVSAMRKALLFVPIVALTPVTFAGDWLARSLFDLD